MKKQSQIVRQTNHCLAKIIGTELSILKKVKSFVSKSGGKRIRPLLHCSMAKLLGYEGVEWRDVGAIGELIHAASLLHDDVIDEAQVRRQAPSLNFLYGNKISVLSGDYLLACALQHLNNLEHCSVLLPLFTRSVRMLAIGELLQMEHEKKIKTSGAVYERIILCKTACLFGCMSEAAYILSQTKKADPKTQLSYRNFGERLGRLFQLRDDFLDYFQTSRSTGKEDYQDLKRGLISWPIIVLYKSLNKNQRCTLTDIFTKTQKRTAPANLKRLQTLFECVDLRKKLEREIEAEAHILISFLRKHPSSIYRGQILDQLFYLFIADLQR